MSGLPSIGKPASPAVSEVRGTASLEEALRFERLLAELSAGFINVPAAAIDGAIEDGLRRIVEILGVDRSTLTAIPRGTDYLPVTHSWAVDGIAPVPRIIAEQAVPWMTAKARAGEIVVYSRIDELPPEAAVDKLVLQRLGLKSHLMVPLLVAGELIGGLSFGCVRREHTWPVDLVARLRVLAEIFANALARKRAQEEIEDLLGFEHLLANVWASLLTSEHGDVNAAIERGLAQIGTFLRADRLILWELAPRQEHFRATHRWGAEGVPVPPAEVDSAGIPWIAGQIIHGHAVRLARIDELPPEAEADKPTLAGLGTRSLLAVPLRISGEVVGALSLASTRAEREWPNALISRAGLVGEVFANLLARVRAEARTHEAQTETAQFRERLAHLVRIHTMGEMSAAIAHEINQPLMAITNYALASRRRLAEGNPDPALLTELLEKIAAQSARAGDVLNRIRSMVRKQDAGMTELDLGRLVVDSVMLVEMDCQLRDIRLAVRVAPHLPPVVADEIQLQQVVLNLIRNAIESMDSLAASERALAIDVALNGERELVVRVRDRGPGVVHEDLERIFEPFFSTKTSGLGIGLSICRKIIEAHGGRLHALPDPSGGGLFEFTLPAAEPRGAP
jgi:signal transduction histidine kinase